MSYCNTSVIITNTSPSNKKRNPDRVAWQAHLAQLFNKDGFALLDNHVYIFCGDGCLMEGVSAEAASMAGHLGLGKIVLMYDDNQVTSFVHCSPNILVVTA